MIINELVFALYFKKVLWHCSSSFGAYFLYIWSVFMIKCSTHLLVSLQYLVGGPARWFVNPTPRLLCWEISLPNHQNWPKISFNSRLKHFGVSFPVHLQLFVPAETLWRLSRVAVRSGARVCEGELCGNEVWASQSLSMWPAPGA